MIIEAEPAVDQETDIILHAEVNHVVQGHDGQRVRVCVVRAVDRIVEGQEVLLFPEEKAEKMVLEFAVQAGAPPGKEPVQNIYEIICSH